MKSPTTELKIESGIPIPIKAQTKFSEIFRKMKIGDSFFSLEKKSFHAMAKQLGGNVATRKEGDGMRVWRIA